MLIHFYRAPCVPLAGIYFDFTISLNACVSNILGSGVKKKKFNPGSSVSGKIKILEIHCKVRHNFHIDSFFFFFLNH